MLGPGTATGSTTGHANASMLEQGIDSLALVEFLFEVEEKFKVSLESYPDINSLATLSKAIDELRAAQTA